jgi:hypothetical protein
MNNQIKMIAELLMVMYRLITVDKKIMGNYEYCYEVQFVCSDA